MKKNKEIQIGLIGLGTVGTGVVTLLREKESSLHSLTGSRLVLKKIADLDLEARPGLVPAAGGVDPEGGRNPGRPGNRDRGGADRRVRTGQNLYPEGPGRREARGYRQQGPAGRSGQ